MYDVFTSGGAVVLFTLTYPVPKRTTDLRMKCVVETCLFWEFLSICLDRVCMDGRDDGVVFACVTLVGYSIQSCRLARFEREVSNALTL